MAEKLLGLTVKEIGMLEFILPSTKSPLQIHKEKMATRRRKSWMKNDDDRKAKYINLTLEHSQRWDVRNRRVRECKMLISEIGELNKVRVIHRISFNSIFIKGSCLINFPCGVRRTQNIDTLCHK
jgi:hypothetical protein